MRKLTWTVFFFLSLVLALLMFFHVPKSLAAGDSLQLIAPSGCPPAGCAAGQRLNFEIEFTVSPKSGDPNTQVCIYTPLNTSTGNQHWASDQLTSISDIGLVSAAFYQSGQYLNLCTDNLNADEEWLLGGYAQLPNGVTDRVNFGLHIHSAADFDGYVRVKIFQLEQASSLWDNILNLNVPISVVKNEAIKYVAKDENDCGLNKPCFINSGDDLETGLGTGLRDAVMASNVNDEIHVLKDYLVKGNTVLIDKPISIRGKENSLISYNDTKCEDPLLLFTHGGSLKGLTINDGNCNSPSRDLIEINSDTPVEIENNTLLFGNRAVFIRPNSSDVTVAFNQISNNDSYAILRESGISTGKVNIFANNIHDNRSGYQVDCNNKGKANHNFWGENKLPTNNAINCLVNNGKRLGAPILLAKGVAGVQAQSLTVSSATTYAFDGKIGAKRSGGTDFDIIIINHGQGLTSNIPFFNEGSGNIQPCSNFYDVFLAEESSASNLTLSFKYDLNANCVSKIESNDYCGGSDSQKYPLWWYDPASNVTDGWNRTGQKPNGIGAAGAVGQETACFKNMKEIRVTIDNSGRPNISLDLGFTPFVVGLPFINGITLTQFSGQFDGSLVDLNWITSSETNVKGFHVLRSDQIDGVYGRASDLINAIGDQNIGGIYKFRDTSINYGQTYYYKIEVIGKDDKPISTHGPISVMTTQPTTTSTVTLTLTPLWTYTPTHILTYAPTSTPYVYKSSTPIYRPATSTPALNPTRIRTFGPTPTGARTQIVLPTSTLIGDYPVFGTDYPIDWEDPLGEDGYPAPETTWPQSEAYPNLETPTPFQPGLTLTINSTHQGTPFPGPGIEAELPAQTIHWIFIIVGIASGLSLMGALSVILAGKRLS